MTTGMIERDGFLCIPVLSKEFIERVCKAAGSFDAPRHLWPQELRDEYGRLHGQFTKAKAEYVSYVRRDRDSRMTPTAKTITLTVVECLNFDTGRCDPSHQFVADEIGISRRQVERLMPKIAGAGWIDVLRRGCKATNYYRFRVSAEKVMSIIEYMDHLRDCRREERERKRLAEFGASDPTSVSDQSMSDPTSARSLDPTSMSVLDPTSMSDKPLKGTSEDEPLNNMKGSEDEGYALRAREEETELPYDAPASLEDSRRFLIGVGVPSHRMETAMQRHMREALFPCDVAIWKQEARDGRTA